MASTPGSTENFLYQQAETLNAEGLQTVKGRAWSARRVMDFRLTGSYICGFTTV